MDEQTRKDVDEACLRLMGHEDLRWLDGSGGWWWAPTFGDQIRAPMSPSRQPALVVPLAEALRDKKRFPPDGWHVAAESLWLRDGWCVRLLRGNQQFTEHADTLPEALALAAARAVGTET